MLPFLDGSAVAEVAPADAVAVPERSAPRSSCFRFSPPHRGRAAPVGTWTTTDEVHANAHQQNDRQRGQITLHRLLEQVAP
jgi:hypothetical protein